MFAKLCPIQYLLSYIHHATFIGLFMPHTISYVSDWSYYEVKLVFIILREDGSKTSTEDAREVANQWVSNNKTHIEFLLLLVHNKMSIIFVYYPLSKLTHVTREVKLRKTSIYLHRVIVQPLVG